MEHFVLPSHQLTLVNKQENLASALTSSLSPPTHSTHTLFTQPFERSTLIMIWNGHVETFPWISSSLALSTCQMESGVLHHLDSLDTIVAGYPLT